MTQSTIHSIYGPMFSGKTSYLLKMIESWTPGEFVVVKKSFDQRFSEGSCIQTHHLPGEEPKQCPALVLDRLDQLHDEHWSLYEKCTKIAIDEGQFFPELLSVVLQWKEGLRGERPKQIWISGLSTDYLGQGFSSFPALISLSDERIRLRGQCAQCGEPADFSHLKRLPAPSSLSSSSESLRSVVHPTKELPSSATEIETKNPIHVDVGGNQYEPRCFRHFPPLNGIKKLHVFSHLVPPS